MTSSSLLSNDVVFGGVKVAFQCLFCIFPFQYVQQCICSNFLELGEHVFLTKFGSLSQETLKGSHFWATSFFPMSQI